MCLLTPSPSADHVPSDFVRMDYLWKEGTNWWSNWTRSRPTQQPRLTLPSKTTYSKIVQSEVISAWISTLNPLATVFLSPVSTVKPKGRARQGPENKHLASRHIGQSSLITSRRTSSKVQSFEARVLGLSRLWESYIKSRRNSHVVTILSNLSCQTTPHHNKSPLHIWLQDNS